MMIVLNLPFPILGGGLGFFQQQWGHSQETLGTSVVSSGNFGLWVPPENLQINLFTHLLLTRKESKAVTWHCTHPLYIKIVQVQKQREICLYGIRGLSSSPSLSPGLCCSVGIPLRYFLQKGELWSLRINWLSTKETTYLEGHLGNIHCILQFYFVNAKNFDWIEMIGCHEPGQW